MLVAPAIEDRGALWVKLQQVEAVPTLPRSRAIVYCP